MCLIIFTRERDGGGGGGGGRVEISNDPQVDGVKEDTLSLSTSLPKLGFHNNLPGGFQTVKNILKASQKNTFFGIQKYIFVLFLYLVSSNYVNTIRKNSLGLI